MRVPDVGRILRFLAALPLSRRTIPAPAGHQRLPTSWQQGDSQVSWAGGVEKVGKHGWVSQPTAAGMLRNTHTWSSAPQNSPQKLIYPGSSATTEGFLNGSLTEQEFGSGFMPPFANSCKERPSGEWENRRRIFLPVLRLESMLLTLRSSQC